MIRLPPRSTRTDTLFPYTTLFRSTPYQTFNAGRDKSFSYRFETPGRVIVFSGDTGPSEALTELARGADILVSEVIDTEDAVRMIASDPHFPPQAQRSEEHTSELQSLMRISYAVFCLKKTKIRMQNRDRQTDI